MARFLKHSSSKRLIRRRRQWVPPTKINTAFRHAHGAVQWNSADVATTVYTVSRLGFEPKAIRFYWVGVGSATDTASQTVNQRRGIGFASSTTSRRCVGTFGLDAAANMDTDSIAHDAAVAVTTDGAGAITGLLDLNSITTDGFTLIVDDQGAANVTVFWEAWGGSDISTVTIGDIAEPAATGTQDYTATGFTSTDDDSQVVMFAGVQSTAAVNTGQINDSGLCIGFATGTAAGENIVLVGNNDEASAAADSDGYARAGECLAQITVAGGNPSATATLSAFGTDLFTLNWTARATTSRRNIYMAIKGGSWKAGGATIDANTLNATSAVTGLAFKPVGLSLMSRFAAEDAAGTATVQDRVALGSVSSIYDRRSMSTWDEDTTTAQQIDVGIEYDQALSLVSAAGAANIALDIANMGLDGFTLIVDAAGTGVASTWYGYLAFGAAVAVASIGAADGAGAATGVGLSTADATGAADGSGAATSTGVALFAADGAAAGTGAASGAGIAAAISVGDATCTGTATATGQSATLADGTAIGTGAATGTGQSSAETTATATGTGEASGAGLSTALADGAATATGAASADGAAAFVSVGSADGTSTAAGVGAASTTATGASDGAGAATGVGSPLAIGVGAAIGAGEASAVSVAQASDGAASGTGTASGAGQSTATGTGSSTGTGEARATGASVTAGQGATSGSGVATGAGNAAFGGVGSSDGTGAATGVGQSEAIADGAAAGTGTLTGVGAAAFAGDGSASGTGDAAATALTDDSYGTSVGTGTAAADGMAWFTGTGAASGAGAAQAVGASLAQGTGSATGEGQALGVGLAGDSIGEADGTGAATGIGQSTALATGEASGTGETTAIGAALVVATGAASGTGTADAEGSSIAASSGTGAASGTSTATGVGQSIATAAGAASGVGEAIGIYGISTGPFFFAWTGPAESFGSQHQVEDEEVFAFEITHSEGEFATLAIDIKNPRVGLLNAGRSQWMWLSWDNGAEIVPLFYGRLIGVPQAMQNEVVRLEFVARPADFDAQKEALAATLRVAPYWDPAWISEDARVDPDVVLEARSELWHIDRVTHALTTSNIITGEDDPLEIGEDHFYDALSISYSSPPGRHAVVTAQAVWQQQAVGSIDITSQFPPMIHSYTAKGLIDNWPEPDTTIGGGWSVKTTSGTYINRYTNTRTQFSTADGGTVGWLRTPVVPQMTVAYEADREFAETLTFTLAADVQPLMTDPGDEEVIRIDLSANVDEPVDPPEESGETELLMPIRLRSARRYFQTERGRQSVDYLICLARAQLLARARAIDITCAIPFASGVGLTCRMDAAVNDNRLPGGTASGKVKGYLLKLDGDTGEASCQLTIGATVGNGGSVAAAPGTPSYVETGYVETGYQHQTSAASEVLAGEVTIEPYDDLPINDDGIDFTALTPASVVEAVTIYNGADDQAAAVYAIENLRSLEDYEELKALMDDFFTYVELDMVSLNGGPYETSLPVNVSLLKVPKTIDLEAEAA